MAKVTKTSISKKKISIKKSRGVECVVGISTWADTGLVKGSIFFILKYDSVGDYNWWINAIFCLKLSQSFCTSHFMKDVWLKTTPAYSNSLILLIVHCFPLYIKCLEKNKSTCYKMLLLGWTLLSFKSSPVWP